MTKWISVKDRLPERLEQGFRTYIIASFSNMRKMYCVSTADWRNNYFQDSFGDKILIDDGYWEITHWIPLPAAPEEE